MASAQDSLASAHRNAARSIAQANRQVEDAERALGQAARRAMEQREQAAENVERAEESLSDAKRESLRAEENLTRARQDAAAQLADLNDQLERGKLDERDATLRVQEAQQELNKTQAEYDAGKATELQLQRAQLAFDQSVQAAAQQKKDYAQLQKDAEAAKKAGVDGNEDVKRAAEQLAGAQQGVIDKTEAVADAQKDAAKAQVEAARSVADAQRALSDAVDSAADTQVQAAESVKAAERGVESARLSSIDTTAKAATKSDEYREALAKLTPEQRKLYESLSGPQGLIPAFKEWSKSLQPDTLPIFTRAVDGAKKSLPGLTPLVKNSAGAVGELMDRASRKLKNPFWTRFKKGVAESAKPAIVGLGVSFGHVFEGMAGVIDAFFPHMTGISDEMQRITGRFARWGTGLRGSPEFEGFLRYVKETGPGVAETLGNIFDALFEVAHALTPIAGPLLTVIGAIASGIATVAEEAPWLIQALYGIIVVTKLWTIAQWALNAAMTANPIGLVVLAVAALTAAVVLAWNRWPAFRNAVTTTWTVIRVAAQVAWTKFLKPAFDNMWAALRVVGFAFLWLYNSAVRPVSDWVASKTKWLYGKALKPIFDVIWSGLKWVGEKFLWLYNSTVKPVADWISDKVGWLWGKGLSPAFEKIKSGISAVSNAFKSAKRIIKENWADIARTAVRPVNWIIDLVYTKGIKKLFDSVAKYVGMGKLPNAPKLLSEPEGFADGGRTKGGVPGKDSIPALLMQDEYVVKRDSARKVGFGTLEHINRYGELPGVQRYADGGIVGGIWDWTKDTVSDVIGKNVRAAVGAGELMTNPGKAFDGLMRPVVKLLSGAGKYPLAQTLAKLPPKMIGGLRKKVVESAAGLFTGGPTSGGGDWAWPVLAAMGTRYGVAGSMWSSGFHTGTDFPAAAGTPVKAVANGRVASATSGGPYGRHVLIDHGGGLASLYAHLSRMQVQSGAGVLRGQVIGAVGATGNTTGPHLHLEARRNGRPVNAEAYLFDDGGFLQPGMNLVANGTGKPEPVFTAQQWADIRGAKSGGSDRPIIVENHTYLGTREITDIIDTRINIYDGDIATDLNNGRWV
ncbi:peptidoglycan DD-metalloendopeptidase family protein [Streptomyces sp. AC512_CC834]|uniref:peptidoglycan DD-metalloendopeptidase family protein n=1 Tax=Streptomyces sp. AC512_CC834 TaxID=2823691 RepID=UPI001C2743BA|nr:peptidoglycan DD-metalloendopeptidase family protein [Streptomyces sp. AC512_CC834]